MRVFDPGRDAVREGVLEPKARHPADMRIAAAKKRNPDDADLGVDVRPGDAAHGVQERAVYGDAGTADDGGEPIHAAFAVETASARRVALDVRAREAALDSK